MRSTIRKRSIKLAGHKTTVSLEDEFWTSLKDIAQERDQYISDLIAEIDGARQDENLSSTIRMFILHYYRDKLDRQEQVVVPPTSKWLNSVGRSSG
jgi:predicted DNA-binding ribbon-helix-helix protein